MYCVNCGQAVEGSIPICAHCARLVIEKEEEKERFMELIRREAQATISKDDASVAVDPEIEPEVGTEVEPEATSEVEPLTSAPDEHNQDNQQSTEEATAEQTKHAGEFIFFFILFLLFVIILDMILA